MGIIYTPSAVWATTATLAEDAVDDDVAATWNGPIQTVLDRTEYLYEKRCKTRNHSAIGTTVCPGNGISTTLFTKVATVGSGVGSKVEINVGIVYSYTSIMFAKLRIDIDGVSEAALSGTTKLNGDKLFLMHRHVGTVPVAGFLDCYVKLYNGAAAPAYDLTIHSAWCDFQVWGV